MCFLKPYFRSVASKPISASEFLHLQRFLVSRSVVGTLHFPFQQSPQVSLMLTQNLEPSSENPLTPVASLPYTFKSCRMVWRCWQQLILMIYLFYVFCNQTEKNTVFSFIISIFHPMWFLKMFLNSCNKLILHLIYSFFSFFIFVIEQQLASSPKCDLLNIWKPNHIYFHFFLLT